MASDEQFLLLVQKREILFNPKSKEHHNRNVVDKLWKEVGEEMNMTENDCKQKWTNLRNSYARHLRNQKRPSGSGGEHKPKWHLADAMSFLKDFVQHRKQKGNSEKELQEEESMQSATEDSPAIHNENMDVVPQRTHKRPGPSDFERQLRRKKQLQSQQIVGPMIEFLKSNTKKITVEHPLLNYVKGVLPDYDTLTARRQRAFRLKIVTIMNNLMDEQEMESSLTSYYDPISCSNSEVSVASL